MLSLFASTALATTSTCSTLGPGAIQNSTARVGGTLLGQFTSATPATCAAACCAAANASHPCRSWTLVGTSCELRSGYSSPASNASATSGVVYRTDAVSAPYSSLRGFNYVPPQVIYCRRT